MMRDAQQVEPAVAELRREQRALEAADADREQVSPERDREEDAVGHGSFVARRARPEHAGAAATPLRDGQEIAGRRGVPRCAAWNTKCGIANTV